ncbi:MAG: hypothetical protein AAB584_02330 [Patescibacteria group bacterium]
MLPPKTVKEFKELFRKFYKIELSDEEASFRANNLFNLYEAVYGGQKLNKDNQKTYKNLQSKT